MKKHLFILILALPMFIWQGVKGQGYIPLLDTNKRWTTLNRAPQIEFTYWTRFSGDTIIGGKNYMKVIISDTIPYPNYLPSEIVAGFIREDTINKRVYFMNTLYEEGLIYDFGANKGDTIHIHNKCFYRRINYPIESYPMITMIVDTIFTSSIIPPYIDTFSHTIPLLDNIERKVIVLRRLSTFIYSDVWIEGIGSIYGVMESGSLPPRVLLCYSEFNNVIYFNPQFNECVRYDANINEYSNNDFKIYPNPAKDYITVRASNFFPEELFDVNIFDITGRLLIQINDVYQYQNINIQDLDSGMYILNVIMKDRKYNAKFIINK